MNDEVENVPLWTFFLTGPLALAGMILAAARPGTAAFWLAPLLVLPVTVTGAMVLLSPWDEISPTRRRVAATLSTVLAVGGALWALVASDERSYLLGGLMTLPLIAVLLARSESDPRKGSSGPGDPASDLPQFD